MIGTCCSKPAVKRWTTVPGAGKSRRRKAVQIYACAFQLDTYLGDPDGVANNGDETYWLCRSSGDVSTAVWVSVRASFDRYSRGDSESDRLFWYLNECAAGRC